MLKDLFSHIKGEYANESKYDRIIRKMGDLIKKSEKQNIKLNEIFSCFNKENLIYFQKILKILSSELEEDDITEYLDVFVNELLDNTGYKMDDNNKVDNDYKIRFQIHDIFVKILNFIDSGYLYVDGGEIKCKDIRLSPDDENFKRTINSSMIRACDGLIDKNGKFYFAYNEHEYMVQYLMAMSIDLTNALRVHQSHLNKEFALSSFCHYYSKGSNEVFKNDTNLALVKKQLETLKKILSLYHSDKEYILSVLKNSINLGFDFLSTSKYSGNENFDYKVATHNIMQLSKVFEDVDFSSFYDKILERSKYLHSANTLIDN